MVAFVCWWILTLYVWILIGRIFISWIPQFSPGWTPKGLVLVLVEGIYTITDPPIRWVQRVVPPLRIGNVSLDMSVLVLIIGLQVCQVLLRFIPF